MRLSLVLLLPTISAAFVVPQIAKSPLSALAARKAKDAAAAEESSSSGMNMNPAKKAALDGVMQQIERSYGRGSIMKLGDAEGMVVESIGSGALTLGESRVMHVSSCYSLHGKTGAN